MDAKGYMVSAFLMVLGACEPAAQHPLPLQIKTYDYQTHDPAKVKWFGGALERRNMSLQADFDDVRLEKRIPLPK